MLELGSLLHCLFGDCLINFLTPFSERVGKKGTYLLSLALLALWWAQDPDCPIVFCFSHFLLQWNHQIRPPDLLMGQSRGIALVVMVLGWFNDFKEFSLISSTFLNFPESYPACASSMAEPPVRVSDRLGTESCPLCVFHNTSWMHFIFTHFINQLQEVRRMFN